MRGGLLTAVTALTLGVAGPAEARAEPPLRLAAASDLRHALPRLLEAFDEGRGGGITTTFGSSGKLHAQIRQGAPFDVFFSADAALVDDLVARRLARGETRAALGDGRLVLWCRPGAAYDPQRGLAGLRTVGGLRLAIAHPDHAPYGRAARSALVHAGVWHALAPHVVRAENVGQAAQLALAGHVTAALIARPLLQAPTLASGRWWQVPPEWHPPLHQEAVVLSRSRTPLAERLLAFAACARGQAIWQAAGLAPPSRRPKRGMIPSGIR